MYLFVVGHLFSSKANRLNGQNLQHDHHLRVSARQGPMTFTPFEAIHFFLCQFSSPMTKTTTTASQRSIRPFLRSILYPSLPTASRNIYLHPCESKTANRALLLHHVFSISIPIIPIDICFICRPAFRPCRVRLTRIPASPMATSSASHYQRFKCRGGIECFLRITLSLPSM